MGLVKSANYCTSDQEEQRLARYTIIDVPGYNTPRYFKVVTDDANSALYFLGGMIEDGTSLKRTYLYKTDLHLNKIWERLYQVDYDTYAFALTPDGNHLFFSSGYSNLRFVHIDPSDGSVLGSINAFGSVPVAGIFIAQGKIYPNFDSQSIYFNMETSSVNRL